MLPMELLDIILQKTFLEYALSGEQSTDMGDEFLFKLFSSVDFCWFQRLRKHRFKKIIWRHLSKFYEEFYRGSAIFMSNRLYLEDNIQLKDLISGLRSADCLTDLETRLLSRQTFIQSTKKLFRKNNNPELLHVMRTFDDAQFSDFIRCLHKPNEQLITRVAGIGGVLVKAIILNQDTSKRQSLDQRINDLQDKTKQKSQQMKKLISRLKDNNVQIFNSLMDRWTVVWIWCQSQAHLEQIQKLNESNMLIEEFTGFKPPSLSAETKKSEAVSICRDQFKKRIADPYLAVRSLINDEIKHRIHTIWDKFVSDVEPDRLIDWLVQGNVITSDQWQRIRNDNPTTQDRCLDLLNHLFSIPHPTAFLVVWQALSEENHYLLEHIDYQYPGELRYKLDPVFVQKIRTKAAEVENKGTCGLAILDGELFVVSAVSSQVEVYDSMKFSLSRRLKLKELFNALDIGSCSRNKCLYIFDYKGFYHRPNEILRFDANGKLIKKWSTGGKFIQGLSVTDESNVILTNENSLHEYSPDGELIREINVSVNAGIRFPRHAIKLTNGHFVVSHDLYGHGLHSVSVMDTDGKLKNSFGGICGTATGQMFNPFYFVVDGNGFVMVADRLNSRVLLLDSDLEFKREILSKGKHGLQYPSRILLDESNNRLLVADNQRGSNGRIFIFQFR